MNEKNGAGHGPVMRRLTGAGRFGKVFLAAGMVFWLTGSVGAQAASVAPKTPGEEAFYRQYTQNEAVGRFLSEVDTLAKELVVKIAGRTRDVADYPGHDLFLAVLTDEGASSPAELDRKKTTLLITASQHGNEQSAKEAALRLIRDLAVGELKPLLKRLNILIMPQTNPYGNRFDVRRNETGLDMNRDHIKLEAAGVEAIHRVFRTWLPEMTIDVHEKGDDYHRVNIGCVSNINISRVLEDYSRRTLLAETEAALQKRGLTFHEYLVTEEMGSTGAAGVETAGAAASREEYTRRSTTDLNDGRNSLGIFETLSFIQECASRHDLETLEARTGWQYWGLRSMLEAAAGHSVEIAKLVRDLRAQLLEKGKTYDASDIVCLRSDYARDPQEPTLALKAFERAESPFEGILKVNKKAGEPFTAADVAPYPEPASMKVVAKTIKNWFPNVVPKATTVRPLAYIIPAANLEVVETLLRLGIEVRMFIQDQAVEVEALAVEEIAPASDDYLAPLKIVVRPKPLSTVRKKGDFFVSCGQPAARLVPCLLEPESEFGVIRYRKFHLVPEAGAIFAFYRVVKPQVLRLVPYKGWRTD